MSLSFQNEPSAKTDPEKRRRAFELVDDYLTNLDPAMFSRNMGSCGGMTSLSCGGGSTRFTPNHPSEAGRKHYYREPEKFDEMLSNPYIDEAIRDRQNFLRGEAKQYGFRAKLHHLIGSDEKEQYLKNLAVQMGVIAGVTAAVGTLAATKGIFDAAGLNNAAMGAAYAVTAFNGLFSASTLAGLPRNRNEQIDFEEYSDIKRSLVSLKSLKAQFKSVETDRKSSYYMNHGAKNEEIMYKEADEENRKAGYLRADPKNPSHTALLLKKRSAQETTR